MAEARGPRRDPEPRLQVGSHHFPCQGLELLARFGQDSGSQDRVACGVEQEDW